jgi:hypothetical protein
MSENGAAQALFDNMYAGVVGQSPAASDLIKAALTLVVTALVHMPEHEREQELSEIGFVVRDAVEARLERERLERRSHLKLVHSDREPA